jgi:hypothetical protein
LVQSEQPAQYAVQVIRLHLGSKLTLADAQEPYIAFCANHSLLKKELSFAVSNQELDHYLWLAGLYLIYRRKPNAEINREARALPVPFPIASD